MNRVMVSAAMSSPEWWAYSLDSTLDDDPCGGSSPLVSPSQCPLPGVQPGDAYTATLEVLRQGILSPHDAKVLLARAKCMRKWRIASSSFEEQRKNEALDGFIQRNNAARSLRGCETIPWAIASRMRDLLSRWLPERELEEGKFGPGACAERWNHCVRWSKSFQWVACDYNGKHKPFGYSAKWPEQIVGHADMSNHVARLCAVPKQYDKDRLITVEPAFRTFVQQAVRSTLLESIHAGPLAGTCMDLGYTDGQRIQRRLAKEASARLHLATLDLKDASDHISWEDVQNVFPAWVVTLLENTRSNAFTDPRTGEVYPMAIFAGMGNATTFVVETLFFTAYVKSFAWTRGLKGGLVSTFGDDVICPTDVAELLVEEGQSPSFVINEAKSFWGKASLRESCGIFAYQGEDITVPRMDGFPCTPAGAEGVAAVGRSCFRDPMFWGLCSALCADSGLPVGSRWVEGYPSLVDPLCDSPISEEFVGKTEWSAGLCQSRIKLPWWEPRYTEVRCTDAPNDSVTNGLLGASILGQLRTVRRNAHSYVKFPSSELLRVKDTDIKALRCAKRWHQVLQGLPPTDEDLKLARAERRSELRAKGIAFPSVL